MRNSHLKCRSCMNKRLDDIFYDKKGNNSFKNCQIKLCNNKQAVIRNVHWKCRSCTYKHLGEGRIGQKQYVSIDGRERHNYQTGIFCFLKGQFKFTQILSYQKNNWIIIQNVSGAHLNLLLFFFLNLPTYNFALDNKLNKCS